jgi:hypothetical protein
MKQGYKFGVAWIATNDNAGSRDDTATVASYISTLLLADLFDKDPMTVAADIVKFREKQKIGPQASLTS